MVAPADFKPWDGPLDIPQLQQLESKQVQQDSVFTILSRNVSLLGERQNKPVPLDLEGYRSEMAWRKKVSAEDERLLRLPAGKELDILPATHDESSKGKHYEQWLKKISTDIYINQAVKIISDMTEH
jgi:carboxyl-terminal processing protease